MILVNLAIVGLVLICAWVLAVLLLRLSGLTLAVGGAGVVALSGNANGILVFAIGAAHWPAGQCLYFARLDEQPVWGQEAIETHQST